MLKLPIFYRIKIPRSIWDYSELNMHESEILHLYNLKVSVSGTTKGITFFLSFPSKHCFSLDLLIQ